MLFVLNIYFYVINPLMNIEMNGVHRRFINQTNSDKSWLTMTSNAFICIWNYIVQLKRFIEKLIDCVLFLLPMQFTSSRTIFSHECLEFVYLVLWPRSRKNSHSDCLLSKKMCEKCSPRTLFLPFSLWLARLNDVCRRELYMYIV